MDKTDYIRLLSAASVDNTSKFIHVDDKRPKSRGRPSKHYHPLLQKEKELRTTLREILPEEIANTLSPKSSRLAHLYGLPKTHKATLSMRPILSATGTYNHKLAKWLEEKLKPLSINEYTITDAFDFADEVRNLSVNEDDILVSYDVTALFTNVPLDETINILVNKAFADDWFNKTYGLNLQKDQLVKLLEIATTNQLFQFDGPLYEQTDGVAMGSPLGSLMANVFMCHLEEKLTRDGLMLICTEDTLMILLQECQILMLPLCFLLPSMAYIPVFRSRWSFLLMIGFLSSASRSSRMEQNLKLKSIESQPILACSYISTAILINAIKTLY